MDCSQVVVFRLGCEEYAVPIEQVREIINWVPVTHLPNSPYYVSGIINVRGSIIPVIDLAAKLGLAVAEKAEKQIIIIESMGRKVGVTVDQVAEVLRVTRDNFADAGGDSGHNSYVNCVYTLQDRIILMLDLERSLADASAA